MDALLRRRKQMSQMEINGLLGSEDQFEPSFHTTTINLTLKRIRHAGFPIDNYLKLV